jgi:hypothetical protein
MVQFLQPAHSFCLAVLCWFKLSMSHCKNTGLVGEKKLIGFIGFPKKSNSFYCAWSLGYSPPSITIFIPFCRMANSRLVFEVHYGGRFDRTVGCQYMGVRW